MRTDIVHVVGIILRRLHHLVKLRQDHACDTGFIGHLQIFGMIGADQFDQLRADSLGADPAQRVCQYDNAGDPILVDAEIQLGGKANGSQDAQRVL